MPDGFPRPHACRHGRLRHPGGVDAAGHLAKRSGVSVAVQREQGEIDFGWVVVRRQLHCAFELAFRLVVALQGSVGPTEVADAIRFAARSDLAGLVLDEGRSIGYTIRAMTAGLWADLNADDLETTLIDIVNAGGDTDTNGAVAGPVLGARFGVSAIPQRWFERLPDSSQLESLADRLCDVA